MFAKAMLEETFCRGLENSNLATNRFITKKQVHVRKPEILHAG